MAVINIPIFVTVVILIEVVTVKGFQSCPSVCTCKWKNGKRWVECQKKQQISIPDNIDPETQVLDLGGNNLQILPREVFSRHGLLNLQKLKLSNCNIGQIDPTAFRGLTNLVELDLSSNLLTSVPTPTFSDIPYLRELALNNNPLQKVEGHAFEMVPQIVALDVSGCQIKKISARAFHNIEQLERLYLHNNKIEEVKQRTVESMGKLHSLTLHGNPWKCDCQLRPLIDWLVDANLPMVDLPRCKSPDRLAGQRFADIALDNFACTPELLPSPRYIEANIGSNASLLCKVGSVPNAEITWQKDGIDLRNNSYIGDNRGDSTQYIMVNNQIQAGQMLSRLVLTSAMDGDSGQYKCIAENKAGRVETNYTLNVGYFSGPGSLNTGEIVGICITIILLVMIVIVIIAVLVLKVRPGGLMREKMRHFNGDNSEGSQNISSPGHSAQMEMSYTSVQSAQNGSVVINGQTYTQSAHGGGTSSSILSNGFINPDVIPTSSISANESVESVQNRLNNTNASELLHNSDETEIISPSPNAHPKNRYANLPLPISSVGVGAALGLESQYNTLRSQRHSFTYSPHIFARNNSENNRLYGSGTLRENYPPSFSSGMAHVNDSFSDDTGCNNPGTSTVANLINVTPPTFHRDLRLYSDNNSYQTRSIVGPDSLYDQRHHNGYFSQPSYGSSSPFFHGTLPKNHSQRLDWVASPLRLPDWSENGQSPHMWSNQDQQYPADYGLPVHRGSTRPEIHLAHNPLDTLEEEDVFPDQTFSSSSIHTLEMLQASGSAMRMAPVSDNSESSGRGSSSSGSAKDRSWNIPTSSPSSANGGSIINGGMINGGSLMKKPFQTASARESPDEGIQTDSGTDV